jgi:REP element-mobilizing transposase RayT
MGNKNLPGALHYVTANVLNRRRIFSRVENCWIFAEELQRLRAACKLIAFVIMLDHVHFIINPKDGDIQNSVRQLKSLSARRLVDCPARFLR